MLKFTDPLKYVMGIGTAYATSLKDGSVVFWSDKYQEGNTTFSASEMVNSGGIGNGPAIILYNDPNISVSFTAADYNEFARAAATGAVVTAGAPVETTEVITASSTSLTIAGAYTTGLGMSKPVCYVQEAGVESPVVSGGVAYEITTGGVISGFAAVSGHTYVVTYYATQANATLTTYSSDFNGDAVRFVYRRPIYVNYDPTANAGDLFGWLIDIIPCLKLNPSTATTNGSQSSFSTTAITGRAVAYDQTIINLADYAEGADCTLTGAPLMYSLVVPCDPNDGIEGIVGALGGTIALTTGDTYQLTPAVVVNGRLGRGVAPNEFTYASSATGVATVGASSGTVAAVSAGSAQITVTYAVGGTTYTDKVDVTVTA
jgi:hypothetical protein